jgi:hypothetical protein
MLAVPAGGVLGSVILPGVSLLFSSSSQTGTAQLSLKVSRPSL